MTKQSYWTNPSVLSFAQTRDPIGEVTQKARRLILDFIESGGSGPPFDAMEIARFRGIELVPSAEVRDARTSYAAGKTQIEFNPSRPKNRIRYSICHEIIHTLFPDWKQETRYRAARHEMRGDGWQLEMLCNIGAAELLMPIGSFPELEYTSIDKLLELHSTYDASMEAILLRFAKLTHTPAAIFSASRVLESERYKVDYAVRSASFADVIPQGLLLPHNSVVSECTAIGFTSKGQESWDQRLDNLKVECVGIQPYPYQTYPRVIGVVSPSKKVSQQSQRPLTIKGDATRLRGTGNRILAFVVNDKTPRWGAGFALAVRKTWEGIQKEFIEWAEEHPQQFKLGNIHLTEINPTIKTAALICQHGYGGSAKPRIRYKALGDCLDKLAVIAQDEKASVHMPKIGSGQAGGNWSIIHEMIEDALSRRGVPVTIYDLPHRKEQPQQVLDFTPHALI